MNGPTGENRGDADRPDERADVWSRRPGAAAIVGAVALCCIAVAIALWLRPVTVRDDSEREWRQIDQSLLDDMRVDLNSASVDELQVLPMIGPTLAQRIVTDRNTLGPFATIADLARVSGIGPRTIERIRPHVTAEHSDPQP